MTILHHVIMTPAIRIAINTSQKSAISIQHSLGYSSSGHNESDDNGGTSVAGAAGGSGGNTSGGNIGNTKGGGGSSADLSNLLVPLLH
jgi:hypothetical protein